MNEPTWIEVDWVLVAHDRQIQLFGGTQGLRDVNLLESALARPKNLYFYTQGDVIQGAAAYGYGLCQNHPFLDGNKRTAFVVMVAFLKINGCRFQAPQPQVVEVMLKLASSQLSEEEFTAWVRQNTTLELLEY
jgi:death-on-curing protein